MKKIIVLLLALTLVLSSCFFGNSSKKEKEEETSTSQSVDKESKETSSEKSSEELSFDDLKDKELVKAVFEAREDSSSRSYKVQYMSGVMEGGAISSLAYKQGNDIRVDDIDEAGFYNINIYKVDKGLRYNWLIPNVDNLDWNESGLKVGRIYKIDSIDEHEILSIPFIEKYAKDDFAKLKNAKMDLLDGKKVLYMEFATKGSDKKLEKLWYSIDDDFVVKFISTDAQGKDYAILEVQELTIGGNYSEQFKVPFDEVPFINTTLKGKELFKSVYEARPDNTNRSYMLHVQMSVKDSEGSFPIIYKAEGGVLTKNRDYGGNYYKLYLESADEVYTWYEGSKKGTKEQAEDRDKKGYAFDLEDYAGSNFSRITKAKLLEEDGNEILYFEANPKDGAPYKENVWYSITQDLIIKRNEVSDGENMSESVVKEMDLHSDYSDEMVLPDGVDFEEEDPYLALVRRVYNNRRANHNRSFDFDYEIKYEDGNGSNSKGHLFYENGNIRTEEEGENIHEVNLYLKDAKKLYAWEMGNFDESGGEALNIEDSGAVTEINNVNFSQIVGMPDFDELARNDFAGLKVAEMINFRDEEVLYMEFENSADNSLKDMIWYSPKKDLMLQMVTVYPTGASVYYAQVFNESFSNGISEFMKVPEDVNFSSNQGTSSSKPKTLAKKIFREMNKEQSFKISLTGVGLYAGQNDKSKFLIARDANNKYIEKQIVGEEGKVFLLSKVLDKVRYSWATIANAPEAVRYQGTVKLSKGYPVEMMLLFANNDFADLSICRKEEYKGQEVAYFESRSGEKISKMWFSTKDSMPLEIKIVSGDKINRHLVTDSYEVGGDYSKYFVVPDVEFTQSTKVNN